jgi:hypothetical protein
MMMAMLRVVTAVVVGLLIGIIVSALLVQFSAMTARPFPPPWSIEDIGAAFVVKDSGGQKLAYVYYEEEHGHADNLWLVCCHRHAGLLRARGSEPMVLSPRRVALRAGRSNLG